jgi:hypothetical protein
MTCTSGERDVTSAAILVVGSIAASLFSGVLGSIIGALTQKHIHTRQAERDSDQALWSYERVLRDMSVRLMNDTLASEPRTSKPYPDVEAARASAYPYLAALPEQLRKDLSTPDPYVQTSHEASEHYGWLANALRDHLLNQRLRWRQRASRWLPWWRRRHAGMPSRFFQVGLHGY